MKITQILEGKPFVTQFGIGGYSTVILIQDEGKNILYDCGSRGCALQLKEGLGRCGLKPDEITSVVISHMHFDHVGNLPLFKNVQIHLSKTEWIAANQNPDEWHCLATCDYMKNHGKMSFLKEGDHLTKAVQVLELPGHTLGLIGLKCGNDTILCSDAIKNRYEMWEDVQLMSVDLEKSKKSVCRIKSNAKYIYPGHDTKLVADCPVNKEEINFYIRFANGTIKWI